MSTLLLLAFVAVFAAGCGSQPTGATSPVSPSPIVAAQTASYAGEWTVTYHVDASIGRYAFTRVGRDVNLTLRLRQIGDRVSGAFLSDGLVTDVEGVVDGNGRLTLTGSEPSPNPYRGSLELLRFEASLDDALGLTGRLQYQSLMPGERSSYSTGATGPIVRATRAPLAITSFAGTWGGFFNTTQCIGARYCLLDSWGDITFDLADSGGEISGTVQFGGFLRVPVSGRASGDHVDLRPVDTTAGDGTVARLSRSTTGRITGTVTVVQGWTTDVDLIGVALTPAAR